METLEAKGRKRSRATEQEKKRSASQVLWEESNIFIRFLIFASLKASHRDPKGGFYTMHCWLSAQKY